MILSFYPLPKNRQFSFIYKYKQKILVFKIDGVAKLVYTISHTSFFLEGKKSMDTLFMQILIAAPIILIVSISVLVIASLGIQARRTAEYKNQELNAILSSIGEGLLVVDLHKKVFIMNQAAGVLLREAPQELIGKKIENVLVFCNTDKKHTSPTTSTEIIDQVFKEQDVLRFTGASRVYVTNKAGSCLSTDLVATPFFHKGELQGAVILLEETIKNKKNA